MRPLMRAIRRCCGASRVPITSTPTMTLITGRRKPAPKTQNKKAKSKDRLNLFVTTLRDGAQTAGIEFSLEDKLRIAGLLDELGVDYVEGGYPGANVVDDAFFAEPRTRRAKFTAFGMTKRVGRSIGDAPG